MSQPEWNSLHTGVFPMVTGLRAGSWKSRGSNPKIWSRFRGRWYGQVDFVPNFDGTFDEELLVDRGALGWLGEDGGLLRDSWSREPMLSAEPIRQFRRPVEIAPLRLRVLFAAREHFRISSLAGYCDKPWRAKMIALPPAFAQFKGLVSV